MACRLGEVRKEMQRLLQSGTGFECRHKQVEFAIAVQVVGLNRPRLRARVEGLRLGRDEVIRAGKKLAFV